MYLNLKSKFKKLSIIILSFLMLITLALATACSDNSPSTTNPDDNDPTTEKSVVDYQLVKNGDFEFNTKEDSTYPYNTSMNWSKSYDSDKTQADSSKGLSGIIDTNSDAFDKLSVDNKPTNNPNTPYAYGLVENKYKDNKDSDDRFNPNASGSKVLMINNTTNDKEGSAQYFKSSSSLSILADKYGKISIWVKTDNLSSLTVGKTPGAYIKLNGKVNTTAYGDIYLDNINTNGEWALYEIYVKGSNLATTTLTLSVGLGKGNGTSKQDYVEGYAFFDNIHFETLTKPEYEAFTNRGSETDVKQDALSIIDCNGKTYLDNGDLVDNHETVRNNFTTVACELDYTTTVATSTANLISGTVEYNTHLINNTIDKIDEGRIAGYTATLSTMNAQDKTSLGTALDDISLIGNTNPSLVYMNFEADKASSATFTSTEISVASKGYQYITFFAKVNALFNGSTKASVQIYDSKAKDIATKYISAFNSFETNVEEDDKNYGDWVKYSIAVYNPTDKAVDYQVKISFGEISKNITNYYELQEGYALIADLKVADTNEDKVKDISNSTFKKVPVYGDILNFSQDNSDGTSSDTYSVVLDKNGEFEISKKPYNEYIKGFTFSGDATYGIINSKYINGTKYGSENVEIYGLDIFKDLKTQGNTYAQAIVLQNNNNTSSYLITPKYRLEANSFNKISLKIRVVGDAKASVNLLNLEDPSNFALHSLLLGEKTYNMTAIVDSTSYTIDGWTEVCFYIATGNKPIEYRLQVVNEKLDGTPVGGAIYVDNPNTTITIDSESEFDKDKYSYKSEYATLGTNYEFICADHTREPSTLKETVDGKTQESTITYQPTEIYAGNDIVKFFKFTTIDVDNVIDKTASSTTPDTEEDEDDGYTLTEDVALQVSTIILTIVLILVILVLVIRKNIKKRIKTQEKVASFYDRDTREKAMKKISDKKQRVIDVEKDDEEKEYDYEEAQNIGEETEEVIIEDTEEVVEETQEVEPIEETVIDVEKLQQTEEVEDNNPTDKNN